MTAGQRTTDMDTARTAARASVIEPSPSLSSMPMYTIYHYRAGEPEGRSVARGDEIGEWIADLLADGRTVALGWELRGQDPPEGWEADR